MLIFGFASILVGYAWLGFVAVWVIVVWMTFKTSDRIDIAKTQGVVAPQPQPYPDMSFAWNNSIREYMRDEITSMELASR